MLEAADGCVSNGVGQQEGRCVMRPKPGPGWRIRKSSVWQHEPSGLRIHLLGVVLGSDIYALASEWPLSRRWDHHTRIAGGNQKRGLMTLALELAEGAAKNE